VSDLKRAIEIAREAHFGQVDKGGANYIDHPLRVMERVDGEHAKIVAVLHDVVEDCPDWTFNRLREEGFAEVILLALESVTKRPLEGYFEPHRDCRRPFGLSYAATAG
jgi:(p)ppGpp synthase/HD superfamily hydrolase